jgi:diguanylate cyclase (GGDEF)-like protein/PAS domain S-box-containing protein
MKSLTLSKKALLICLILGLLDVFQGTFSLINLYRSRNTVNELNSDTYATLYWAGKLKGVAKDQRIAVVFYLFSSSKEDMDKYSAQVESAEKELASIRESYPKFDVLDRAAVAVSAQKQEEFYLAWKEIRDLAQTGKKKEAWDVYNTKLMAATLGRRKMEDELAVIDKDRGQRLSKNAIHAVSVGIPVVWVILFLTIVLGTSSFLLFVSSVRRSSRELKESEDRLTMAILATRTAGLGVWVHAIAHDRMIWDDQMFSLHGIAKDSFAGTFQGCLSMVHPEDRQRVIDGVPDFSQRETISEVEYRIIWPDGSVHYIRSFALGQRNASSQLTQVIGTSWDTTAQKQAEMKLRESEERYRVAFQTSPDAININRIVDGRFIDCNRAFLDMSGYKREEVIGRTSLEVGIWVDAGARQTMMNMLRQNSSVCGLEVQLRKKNGEIGWGQLSASTIELDGVPCILTVVRNITEAKAAAERLAAAQEALLASEVRYRTAFQTSPDLVDINRLDDGTYIDANEAYLDILGFAREEVIGRKPPELNIWAHPDDRQKFVEMLRQNSKCKNLEAQFQKKDGTLLWGLVSASVIELDGVPCVLSVVRDLSDAKAAQDKINNLSFYDPLTHLPNRRLLMDRLLRSPLSASRSRRKRALLFVDLDNFKMLNDALGHQTGDLLLQETALRLDSCVRESDTVARCGGDEFAVMLENLSEVVENAAAQAQIIGEKILAICGLPYMLAGRECHCPSSIGITVFGGEPESANEALQRAEIAMFQAKEAGRNTIRFFSPDLQASVHARAAMDEDIRRAIKAEQFMLYYQPQIDRGHLFGVEALLRWNHPERGFLPPDEFIPLAEETGLILPLGNWVLETACAQIAQWAKRKETAHISVSVNISARQIRHPNFVEQVLSVLKRTGANPKNLMLELTESILVENIEDVIGKMTVLKSHGLSISLDDFGTGYSSLSYLKRLPLDQLKIDKAFIRDIMVDDTSGAIAQVIISLGRAMRLSVIAEGVETEEQREFISRLGCHAFQGFLFSRPLPLEEFERRLTDFSAKMQQTCTCDQDSSMR